MPVATRALTRPRLHVPHTSVFYSKRIIMGLLQIKRATHNRNTTTPINISKDLDKYLMSIAMKFRWVGENVDDKMQLRWDLLDLAQVEGLRKQGEDVFQPILLESNTINTHAFRRRCEIKEFVHEMCSKDVDFSNHLRMMNESNAKNIIEYLRDCDDLQLPRLVKNRGYFSFNNGIYCCETDSFHAYSAIGTEVPSDVVSVKYFDHHLDTSILDQPWDTIPTPNTEKIFMDQKLTHAVRNWFYTFSGRMLYEVGEKDGWQVIPMLLGVAGSGKSTVTDQLIGNIFERTDVGVLSNNCERQWAVSGLIDKLIWICPEIKGDFALEQATFQSMVSGEAIGLAQKFKTPVSTKFTVPGWLAGNVLPDWTDHSGSIARRLIIFRFDQRIDDYDTGLADKIKEELPAFIIKINKSYREAARLHGTKDVWSVVPEEIREFSKKSVSSISPMDLYFQSAHVKFDPAIIVEVEDFRTALKNFLGTMNMDGKVPYLGMDALRNDVSKYKCKAGRATYSINGKECTKDIVMGARLHECDFYLADDGVEWS
jgi:hypothetical protein